MGDVPPDVVTRTSTVLGGEIVPGEVTVIDVELTTVTLVAAVAPNATVAPVMKLVPVIVTDVPPPEGPLFGLTELTDGVTAVYVKSSATVFVDVPPDVVTITSTVPGERVAGDTAVIDVAELTVTVAEAVAPKATVAPLMKFVPVIATDVPPPVGPDVGLIEVTCGWTALYVN